MNKNNSKRLVFSNTCTNKTKSQKNQSFQTRTEANIGSEMYTLYSLVNVNNYFSYHIFEGCISIHSILYKQGYDNKIWVTKQY